MGATVTASYLIFSALLGLIASLAAWESWRDRRPANMWLYIGLVVICAAVAIICLASGDWS